ncbi:MAG: FMN-binding protein [Clostridiaceae bacterium]|nr:FMN-binding protein [Clostridiaceae bacterium]
MLISIILAWVAVLLCIMSALKYIARISGNKTLNRFFHNIHIPFGSLLLVVGVLHGVFAGNASAATLSSFQPAAVLFTLNWGTACFLLAIVLACTYLLHKKLKRKWLLIHRIATAAILICLVLHISDVGIQLPKRFFSSTAAAAKADEQENTSENDNSDVSTSIVDFSGAQLKDGTYQGSAKGYNGTTTVSVVVESGQVTEINVVSQNDTDRFFDQAESVLDDIIDNQSLEVDTVSGATFSSAGLINAVYDALKDAVTSGSLSVTDIDLPAVHKH